jgi:hypothetical protein
VTNANTSARPSRLASALAILAATGAAVCIVVVIVTLITQRPIPGVGFILIPAIPLLMAGQLLAIAWFYRWRRRDRWSMLRWLAEGLGGVGLAAILAACTAGWITAATSFGPLRNGGPAPATTSCSYVLRQHDVDICASRQEFERAGAAEQRVVAGILLAFFAMHTGAALARRRRDPDQIAGANTAKPG